MANDKRSKIDPKTLNRAKGMYLAGTPVLQIAKELDVPRSTINHYIKKSWAEERALRSTQLLETVSNLHATTITTMTKDALIAAQRAITHLSVRPEPPSSKEAVDMVNILDKIQIISDRFKSEEDKEKEKAARMRDVVYNDPFQTSEDK